MGLIKLLLEDIARENETKRMERNLNRNFPYGQKIRITKKEKQEEPRTCAPERTDGMEDGKAATKSEANTFVSMSMEEYEESGQLDEDTKAVAEHMEFEELAAMAERICMHLRMKCEAKEGFLYVATDCGKWYFEPKTEGKVTLYHKNYELRNNQQTYYHKQFEKEWGLQEILQYIYRHDRRKQRRESM